MAPFLQAMALALRASAPICPAQPACPQDDKCTYTSNGVSLQVACATDYYGGDLQSVQSDTLADCLKACAANTQCVATSYVGNNCYLKKTLESGQSNTNVIGGAVLSRPGGTASSTTTAAPAPSGTPKACPATYTCPENNGCLVSGSNAQTYILTCGVDYYGGDLMSMSSNSLQDCTKACTNNNQCVAASYVGGKNAGTCYLKSSNKGTTTNSNVDSIELYAPGPAPSPTGATSTPAPTSSAPSSSVTPPPKPSSTPAATSSSTPAPLPTPAPGPAQAIVNGGFESADMSVWGISGIGLSANTGRSTVNPRTGKYSFQAQGAIFNINPFSVTLAQTVSLMPGKTYNLALSTKQNVPTCVFSGFYNEFPIFANFKFSGTNYATTTAQIPGIATLSGPGVLRISATDCAGTSVWFDDISLTQA